jgi:outer membrane protein OmpA-like peptidoglycan-associated protein
MHLTGLLLATAALAADVDTFTPASSLASGLGSLQGEAPQLGEEGFAGGVLAAFSEDPVIRRFDDGDRAPEVSALAPVHLHGGWTVDDLVRFDVLLPVYAWVDAPLTAYQGAAVGDLRLQATVPVWESTDGAVALAVVPRLGLPTGTRSAAVAQGTHAELLASLGGRVADFGWVANAGATVAGNDPIDDSRRGLGSSVDLIGGGWWHTSEALRLGAELDVSAGLAGGDDGTNNTGTAHVFAQNVLPSGLGLSVGAGTGLIAGIGTPEYRVFGGLTWVQVERDQDADGLVDAIDGCPTEPEDVDGFSDDDGCPDPDNDADGLLDAADRCPDQPEDDDGFDDDDGCPDADNDADGLLDGEDRCPDEAGPQATGGCPDRDGDSLVDSVDACPDDPGPAELEGCPDRDADQVPDFRDACPDEPKPPDEDPARSDGCPKTVFVTRDEIVITERVEFETGKAVLRPVSSGILDQVVSLLQDNPFVTLIEVQGHTDNVGSSSYNQKLSEKRAASVVDYLERNGIDRARLEPRGYGETVPLFSNRTPEGRDNNRRVQFKIVEQARPEPPPAAPAPAPAAPVPAEPAPPSAADEEASKWVTDTPWGSTEDEDDNPWGTVTGDEEPADEEPVQDDASDAPRPPRGSKKR